MNFLLSATLQNTEKKSNYVWEELKRRKKIVWNVFKVEIYTKFIPKCNPMDAEGAQTPTESMLHWTTFIKFVCMAVCKLSCILYLKWLEKWLHIQVKVYIWSSENPFFLSLLNSRQDASCLPRAWFHFEGKVTFLLLFLYWNES